MAKFNIKVYPTVYIRQFVLNSLQESLKKLQAKTETVIFYNESEGYFDITGKDQKGCDEAESRIIKSLLPKLNQSIDERNLKGTYKSLDIIRDEDLIGVPINDEPELEIVKISGQPAKLDDDEDSKSIASDDSGDESNGEIIVETFNISNKVRSIKDFLTSPPQQNMQNGDYLKLVMKVTGTECTLNNRSIQISGSDIESVNDALDRFAVIQATYLGHSKRMIVPCIQYPDEYTQSGLYFCRIPHYRQGSYLQDDFFPDCDIYDLYIILPVFMNEKTGQYGPPRDLVLRKKSQSPQQPPLQQGPTPHQLHQAEQQRANEQMLNRIMQTATLNNNFKLVRQQQIMHPSPLSSPSHIMSIQTSSHQQQQQQYQQLSYQQQQVRKQPQQNHTRPSSSSQYQSPPQPLQSSQRTPTPQRIPPFPLTTKRDTSTTTSPPSVMKTPQRNPSSSTSTLQKPPTSPTLEHQRHFNRPPPIHSTTHPPPTYDYSRPSSSQSLGTPPLIHRHHQPSDNDSISTLDEFQPPLWGGSRSFVNVYTSGISPMISKEPEEINLDGFPLLPKLDEIPKRRPHSRASSVKSEPRRVMRIVNLRSSPASNTQRLSPREAIEDYNFNNVKIALEEGLDGVRGFKGEVKLSAKLGKILWDRVDKSVSKRIWEYTDIKDIVIHELGAIPIFNDCTTANDETIAAITGILPSKSSASSTYEFHCHARSQPQVEYRETVLYMNEGAIDLFKVSISEKKITEIDWISLDKKMDFQLALTTKELVRCDVKPYTTFIKWVSVCPITRQMTFEEVSDFLYVDHVIHRQTTRYKAVFPYTVEVTRVEKIALKEVKSTQFTKAKKLQSQLNRGEVWYDVELVNQTHNVLFKSNMTLDIGKVANWNLEDIVGKNDASELRNYLKTIRSLMKRTEEVLNEEDALNN